MHYFTIRTHLTVLFTIFLSTAVLFQAFATKYFDQVDLTKMKLSIRFDNIPLRDALAIIHEKTTLSFAYNEKEVNVKRSITASFKDATVKEILNELLHHQGFDFQVTDDVVIVTVRKVKVSMFLPGTIQGKITDAGTGESLVGASVVISGTMQGTTTDVNGNYSINKVESGVYKLTVSYIGYTSQEVANVQVEAGNTTRVNVKLTPSSSSLDEIVVTAKTDIILENSSDMSVLKEIRLANNIVTGISHEQITRSMDRDAAEVVRRATGITLADDRFAMVRGFDPRYTLTMLNDFPAPSAESDRSAFSYDLINSANIDRVMIYKMPSAELPSNQAGGTVRIYTKNSSNSNQLSFQLSTQYRPGSSFQEYDTYQGGKYDKLGFDDGSRAMPKNIPLPEQFPQPSDGSAESDARNAVIGRLFPNNWNLYKVSSNLDKRAVLNYYGNLSLRKLGTLNSLSSITYTQTTNINDVDRLFGYQTYDSLGVNTARVNDKPVDSYNSAIHEHAAIEGTRLTGMQNFRWTINDRHAIEWKNLFNQQANDRVILRDERNGTEFPETFAWNVERKVVYKFQARTLYNSVLSGEHKPSPSMELKWRTGYSYTSDQQPDFRTLRFIAPDPLPGLEPSGQLLGTEKIYSFFGSNTPIQNDNFRGYNDLHENTYSAMADVNKTFAGGIILRTGLFYEYRTRQFMNRMFGFGQIGIDYSNLSSPELYANADALFAQNYFQNDGSGIVVYDESGMQQASPYNNLYHYKAINRLQAAYVSANVPLLEKKLTLYAGLRAEHNNFRYPGTFQWYRGNEFIPVKIDQTKKWLLPSAMITYKPGDKTVVRLSYGKSINRQEFRETAPIKVTDIERNVVNEGNFNLKPAEIQNFDLRWELYPAHGDEMLSAGVYYKTIDGAIEPYSYSESNFEQDYIVPKNTPETRGYGLELEARKRLNFLPGRFFSNMALNGNVTLLRTEVNVKKVIGSDSYNELRRDVRPMVNASPYAVNASLYYDNKTTGTQWAIMFNALGQRLATAGTSYTAELYVMPRNTVDISFTQSISEHARIKIGVQDIFNQPIRTYRDRDRSQTYNPGHLVFSHQNGDVKHYIRDYMEEEYRPGSYWSVGLLFTL